MILGVANGRSVAVQDGALLGPANYTPLVDAVCVAVDLDAVDLTPVAAIRIGRPCPPSLGPPGVSMIVQGGHSLTGDPMAPLDADAIGAFASSCGLAHFVVTAAGSPMLADHELAAAEVIAAAVPGARITLSYEFGQAGLRERENLAVRNAGLGPAAGLIADTMAARFPAPVYFARSDTGLVSSQYFRRYPVVCFRGGVSSAERGDGEGEFAAAYGAALASPTASVERILRASGRSELDDALAVVQDEVLTRVVSAGAVPGSARVSSLIVRPLSYLPDGIYRARATAVGATP
jgi:hypothetical protein